MNVQALKTFAEFKNLVAENIETDNLFYVRIGSVAKSGISRTMKFFIGENNVTEFVGIALGMKTDKKGYLRIRGCGMDMIFDTLHSLVSVLGVGDYTSRCVNWYNYNYMDFR